MRLPLLTHRKSDILLLRSMDSHFNAQTLLYPVPRVPENLGSEY